MSSRKTTPMTSLLPERHCLLVALLQDYLEQLSSSRCGIWTLVSSNENAACKNQSIHTFLDFTGVRLPACARASRNGCLSSIHAHAALPPKRVLLAPFRNTDLDNGSFLCCDIRTFRCTRGNLSWSHARCAGGIQSRWQRNCSRRHYHAQPLPSDLIRSMAPPVTTIS